MPRDPPKTPQPTPLLPHFHQPARFFQLPTTENLNSTFQGRSLGVIGVFSRTCARFNLHSPHSWTLGLPGTSRPRSRCHCRFGHSVWAWKELVVGLNWTNFCPSRFGLDRTRHPDDLSRKFRRNTTRINIYKKVSRNKSGSSASPTFKCDRIHFLFYLLGSLLETLLLIKTNEGSKHALKTSENKQFKNSRPLYFSIDSIIKVLHSCLVKKNVQNEKKKALDLAWNKKWKTSSG